MWLLTVLRGVPHSCGSWIYSSLRPSLNDSNTQQQSSTTEVMKEGAERSYGEGGDKFRQRRVGQAYQDPELILRHSPGMCASVTLKRFMAMASPSDLRGCQDSW